VEIAESGASKCTRLSFQSEVLSGDRLKEKRFLFSQLLPLLEIFRKEILLVRKGTNTQSNKVP
jgi:hypothetical protein